MLTVRHQNIFLQMDHAKKVTRVGMLQCALIKLASVDASGNYSTLVKSWYDSTLAIQDDAGEFICK